MENKKSVGCFRLNRKLDALVVSIGIVCMIVGLVSLAQSTVPSGGPYYLQVPTSTWTCLVDQFSNGTYYYVNGTNWNVDYKSTNLTNVEKFALGNTTSGTVYLHELQHNTSLSISATQIVTQQYQGQIKYFTDTGSSSVTDCPVATTGNFTFPSGTSETTILTLATPSSITKLHNLYIDLSVLTQNCTLRVYINFTGSYVEMTSMTVTVAAGSYGLALKDMMINSAWKLTITSAVAEGATRYLFYQYFAETY